MDNRPIGVFDSGVGAFSVLEQLVKIMPNENYVFFGDSGHNPYGQKTKQQLQTLCEVIAEFLIKHDVKIIVIACNTATVASLEYLQGKFKDIDIIGVIEGGAKDAIKDTKNAKIGVCATCFTANSHAYKDKIEQFAKDKNIEVFEEGSIDLAHTIESGFDKEKDAHIIEEFVGRFDGKDIDTLILGCTHYPMIADVFKKYYDGNLVDPGLSTAKTAMDILTKKAMLTNSSVHGSIKYFVTSTVKSFIEVAKNLVDFELTDIHHVDIEKELAEKSNK